MAETIAEMLVRVSADVEDFRSKMDGAASLMDSMASRFTSAGAALSIGVTAPLSALGVASVNAAGEMDSLMRALTVVTGSAEKAQAEFTRLAEVAKLPGLGLEEAVQGAVRLQSAGMAANVAEKALQSFGNALASVGKGKSDLAAVTSQLTQMWNAASIKEEDLKPLRERIPQIAAIMKEMYGTITAEGLRDKGIGPQQFVNDMIAALGKIPSVTGGIKNDIENFKDSLQQSFAQLGNTLTPFVSQFVNTLGPAIQDAVKWFTQLNPEVQRFAIISAGIAAGTGPLLYAIGGIAQGASALMGLIGPLGGAIKLIGAGIAAIAENGIIATIGTTIASGFESATLALAGFGEALLPFLAGAGEIALWVAGLRGLWEAFDLVRTHATEFKEIISGIAADFQNFHIDTSGWFNFDASIFNVSMLDPIKFAFGELTQWISGKWTELSNWFLSTSIGSTIAGVFESVSERIKITFANLAAFIKGAFTGESWRALFADLIGVINGFVQKVAGIAPQTAAAMQRLTDQLNASFENVGKTVEAKMNATGGYLTMGEGGGMFAKIAQDAQTALPHIQNAAAAAIKFADAWHVETDAHKLLVGMAKELNSEHDQHISKLAKLTLELDKYKDKAAETAAILARMANVPPPPDIGGTYSKPQYDENGNQIAGAPVGLNYPKHIPIPQSPDDSELDIPTGSKTEATGKGGSTRSVRDMGEDMAREVDKAFDHISRGIADNIVHWQGFTETIKGSLKSLGSGMLEVFVQRLLSPLKDAVSSFASSFAEKLFGGLTSKVGSWLGNALGGLLGGGGSSGGGSGIGGQVAGMVIKNGVKIGAAVATGGGSEGAEMMGGGGGGSGGSLLDLGMKVADYFKQNEIEKGLDAIEHEVRYSQIHLANMLEEAQKYWPRLKDINDDFYKYFEYFGSLMQTVEGILESSRLLLGAFTQFGSAAGGATVQLGDEGGTVGVGVFDMILAAIMDLPRAFGDALKPLIDAVGSGDEQTANIIASKVLGASADAFNAGVATQAAHQSATGIPESLTTPNIGGGSSVETRTYVDPGTEGVMGSIGQLIEVEQGGWSHLFELLGNGLPDITKATQDTATSTADTETAVTSSGMNTAEGLQQLATAVSNPISGGGSITEIPLTTSEAARAVTGATATTWKAASVGDLNWTVAPDTQLPSGGSRTTAGMLFDPADGYDPFTRTRQPIVIQTQIDGDTVAVATIKSLRNQGIRI